MRCHAIAGLSFGVLLVLLPASSSWGRPPYRAGFAAQLGDAGGVSYGASIEVGGFGFGPAYNAPADRYYVPSYEVRSFDVPASDTPRRYLEPTPNFMPYGPSAADSNVEYNSWPLVENSDDSY